MAEVKLPRRDFLKAAGAAGATGAAMATGLVACSPETKTTAAAAGPETWQVLTPQEVAFFSAAADTIIPKDELSLREPNAACRSSSTASSPAPGAAAPRCTAPVPS